MADGAGRLLAAKFEVIFRIWVKGPRAAAASVPGVPAVRSRSAPWRPGCGMPCSPSSSPLAEKVLRTVIVYALIAVLFRLSGKRGLANMNTFDFVVIFLLSNAVQNAIIGNDSSLIGGVIGAVTLVAVSTAVSRLIAASAVAARIFDGQVIGQAMRRLGLRRSEIDHAVRLQNGDDVAQIQIGELEPGGQLVLTLKASEQGAPPRLTWPTSSAGSAGSRACSTRAQSPDEAAIGAGAISCWYLRRYPAAPRLAGARTLVASRGARRWPAVPDRVLPPASAFGLSSNDAAISHRPANNMPPSTSVG